MRIIDNSINIMTTKYGFNAFSLKLPPSRNANWGVHQIPDAFKFVTALAKRESININKRSVELQLCLSVP